ncbi:MAG: ribonuclease Z [Candidatus Eremiobacteraeota bacterium]|nr:ribonuclease Z [Candidatus Eremiobacteraeota bacterium]
MTAHLLLSFLGTGGALGGGRLFSAFMADNHVLFDCAPTVPLALRRMKKDPLLITHVFITHYHGDHVLGLPFLLAEYALKHRRREPLHVIGPPDIEERIWRLTELSFSPIAGEVMEKSAVRFHPFRDQEILQTAAGISFTPYRMRHFGNSFGFRVGFPGAVLAYSGDTGFCSTIGRLVEGADVAVLEMNSLAVDFHAHLNLAQIEEIRRTTPSRLKIVVTHREDDEVPSLEGVIMAEDFGEYRFP